MFQRLIMNGESNSVNLDKNNNNNEEDTWHILPVKILPKESHGEIQMMKTDFSIWKSK